MFERKKVSPKGEQEKKQNPNGGDFKMDLSLPDLSDLEVNEEEQQEKQEVAKPKVSLFKNLFGGAQKQEQPSGGSCGCFG